jgi:PIN domain nuclease of toxin-antitoxin system
VLDASAVLAVLEDEPGAEEIERRLQSNLAAIGTVNLAERGMPEAEIREALSALALEVYPFDESLAFETGMLRLNAAYPGSSSPSTK